MRVARALLVLGVGAIWAAPARLAAQSPGVDEARRLVKFDVQMIGGDRLHVGPREPATLIAVFATWCRSCADEVASINGLARELAPRGIRLIALNVDKDAAEPVQRWLAGHGGTYPAAFDSGGTVAHALGVVGVPEFHLISGDGRVVFSRRGPLGSGVDLLRRAVAQLEPGKR